MNPVVLGIDTSATVCAGVAVGSAVVASAVVPDTRAHAEQLMPLVQQVVAQAGLGELAGYDSIAVGVGPGPFTGLRVGVVAAVTLAEALGIPVRGVCSLDVLAHKAVAGTTLRDSLVPRDLRDRPEAVAGGPTLRDSSGKRSDLRDRAAGEPSVEPAETTAAFIVATDARRKEWYWASYNAAGRRVAGPFVTAPDQLPDLPRVGPVTDNRLDLDAGVLAAIASSLPEAGLEPLYLRRPDATVPTGRKPTLLPPRLAPRSPR